MALSDEAEFTIGADVTCQDGPCGQLRRVVIDPVKEVVTHLVVEEKHRIGLGRLVPVDLVDTSAGTSPTLRLRCTLERFQGLDESEEVKFLPVAQGRWGYGSSEMLSMPFFRLGSAGTGATDMQDVGDMADVGGMGMGGMGGTPQTVVYDRVPPGEVEVERGQHVLASDGAVGHVRGLVMDPADFQVTHLLLEEGHLWGKKQVAVPIGAVTRVDEEGVHLRLDKEEVGELPPVDVEHD